MAYTEDKKSTGLDVLTGLDAGDLHIVGDISDSGRGKAITQNDLETTIANSSNFINELTSNNIFQSAVNSFVTGGTGLGQIYIDQTPDNGNYGAITGVVDGTNDTFVVSQGEYLAGKIAVYLNGLIQLEGASDDFVESDPSNGEFKFNTPPDTGDIITVVYTTTAATLDNYTVKATTADTTPSFLDDKIEVVSTDNTITVTPSVINPAANEKLRFDLSVDTSKLASSLYPTLVPFGSPGGSPPNPGLLGTIGNFATFNNNYYKLGVFGKASGGSAESTPSNTNGVCHDYSLGKFFSLTITNTSSGNYTLNLKKYAMSAPGTVEATWTCSGFSSVSYPSPNAFSMVVDFQSLKLFLTTSNSMLGTNTIDATSVSANNTTFVFDLSSSGGGTINSTATTFTGAAKFPSLTGNVALINSTTKKFITRDNDNKYTYSDVSGLTATTAISFGDYSGKNAVFDNGILYKYNEFGMSGGVSGIYSITNYFMEMYQVPTSNTILNT